MDSAPRPLLMLMASRSGQDRRRTMDVPDDLALEDYRYLLHLLTETQALVLTRMGPAMERDLP